MSRYCDLDAHTYLPDDIFTKVDIASMTFGLEARAPFVDHLVMELGAALPGPLKLHRGKGKYILKQAFADLVPPAIRSRRKKGFASPTRGWFAGRLRQFARDLLLSPEVRYQRSGTAARSSRGRRGPWGTHLEPGGLGTVAPRAGGRARAFPERGGGDR